MCRIVHAAGSPIKRLKATMILSDKLKKKKKKKKKKKSLRDPCWAGLLNDKCGSLDSILWS